MDPLTHGIIGGTSALLWRQRGRRLAPIPSVAIVGMLGGMAPDLDVLIKSTSDSLLAIQFHRHFTHSLAFIPIGGLFVGAGIYPLFKRWLSFWQCVLYAMAGFSMHGLLDAATNYGTHLFWPFTNRRESWSLISIVDPLFTIPLLAGLLYAVIRRRVGMCKVMLIYAACYLLFGYTQRERATEAMIAHADVRGHEIERYEVKPSIGNNLLWRVQYEYGAQFYISAVRVSPLSPSVFYEGGTVPKFNPAWYKPAIQHASVMERDIERFTFFSDGWVALYPPQQKDAHVLADMRFAMLPNSLTPLWGIRLTPLDQTKHAEFERIGTRKASDLEGLWQMIKGE